MPVCGKPAHSRPRPRHWMASTSSMRPIHREGRQALAPLLRVKKTPVTCNNNPRYLHIVNTIYLHMSLKITTFGYDLEEALPLEHSGLHIV